MKVFDSIAIWVLMFFLGVSAGYSWHRAQILEHGAKVCHTYGVRK